MIEEKKILIYQMCLDHTKNLIFTCGFEHNIYIYDFHDDTYIYKLEGHNLSFNTLNEYENELISLDIMVILKFGILIIIIIFNL